jgi:two-component system response regulator PrrA
VGTSTTSAVSVDPSVSSLDLRVQVVVIDRRHDRGQLMGQVVEQSGIDATIVGYADSSVNALETVARLRPQAVILEIQLPVTEGLDTISALRDDFPDLAIIVCSFRADAATKRDALARGAQAYLVKPFSLRDLRAALRSVTRNRSDQDIGDTPDPR